MPPARGHLDADMTCPGVACYRYARSSDKMKESLGCCPSPGRRGPGAAEVLIELRVSSPEVWRRQGRASGKRASYGRLASWGGPCRSWLGVLFCRGHSVVHVCIPSVTAAVTCVTGVWLSDLGNGGTSLSLWGSGLQTTRCIHELEMKSRTFAHLYA